jgi:hypothetical protein
MASNRKQLEDALIAAHEAGDTEAAELIASELKAVPSLAQSNPAEYDPSSPEFRAQYGATSGMSGFDKFMAGAGKSVMDTGRGLKQLGIEAYGLVRPGQVQDLVAGTPAEQYRAQMSQVQAQDADLMSTGAGVAGNIAGTLATTMLPAGALSKVGGVTGAAARGFINPQTIRAAAAGGAALGAIQPVGTDGSRLANIGIGAATGGAGQAVIKGAQRIAQPIKNALSAVDETAVALLKRAGVPLDAAQASGSQRMMQVKRFLTDNPLTAGAQAKQAEKTAAGFTRAALKEIGEVADVADEEVLARASQRIGRIFDDIAARNSVKITDDVLDDLVSLSNRANATLEVPQARLIQNQIDEIISKAADKGELAGAAYQNIKQNLDLLTNSNAPGVKHWAAQLRGRLDEALQASVSPADFDALKTARKQYGNLQSIIQAVNPDANISPAKLYNAMNVKAFGQKKAMATGLRQKELAKLAKAGKRIIPERMPNSGTTPRGALQLLLPGAVGAGYGAAQGGDLGDVAAYGAAGVAAPLLLQKLMTNPRAVEYLTQGLQGPARNALLGAGSTPGSLVLRGAPMAGLLGLQAQQQ